jgi:tRNA threonylcarbamoyladenosine biosynthesis protein TsaB
MGEVYWAAFDCRAAVPALIGEERLGAPADVALPPGGPWRGAGHGFGAWPDVATRLSIPAVEAERLPHAADIARIAAADLAAGRGVAPAKGLPVYLRDDVVHRR